MLHSVKALDGFAIAATDGQLGKVKDIYFDDLKWTIRYLEVDTGRWLTGRRVLISPISVASIDWPRATINVRLTRQQVNDSPGIDTAKPVSLQHETALSNYYGYPYYWSGPYLWGYTVFPSLADQALLEELEREAARETMEKDNTPDEDPHLRSKDEVVGYRIEATDDTVGHVEDFLFDEKDWSILLMVVDTREWWPGKHVLISPRRIRQVSWEDKSVVVDVTRKQIESSPEYDGKHPPGREDYEEVYRPYQRPVPPAAATADRKSGGAP
ncbi:MAG: PRC-barrel domain-containing protein [Pseudomonadota bacterium]